MESQQQAIRQFTVRLTDDNSVEIYKKLYNITRINVILVKML